jgi:hypothetical protein
MIKKISQLIIISIFLAISLFVIVDKVRADVYCDCYDTSACSSRAGHCVPGAECNAPNSPILGLCPCDTAVECVCCVPPLEPTPTGGGGYCHSSSSSECRDALGSPPNVCCRTGGCSSQCGTLRKWEYCYAAECCVVEGFYEWAAWTILSCPVSDTCERGSPYLLPGICDSTGCSKGGRYKICCAPDGSTCDCLGGNATGICPSGCPNQGPNVTTCPASGPTSSPTSNPTAGPTSTPSLPDCGHTCLNYGMASVRWPDCSCTNKPPASGYTRIGTWNSSDCPDCTGYKAEGSSPTPTSTSGPTSSPTPTSTSGPTSSPTPTASPYCSVILDPSSQVINSDGSGNLVAYLSTNVSVSSFDFSSNNESIAIVGDAVNIDPPYVYGTTIYGVSSGTATITGSAATSPSLTCQREATVNVEAAAWFQTQGGDIYTGASLSNNIPKAADDPNFSLKLDNWPGIITHQDPNEINLGGGCSSGCDPNPEENTNNWVAKSKYEGKPYGSFQFFKKKFATQMQTVDYPEGVETITNAPSGDRVYYAQGNKTLDGNWTLGNNRWIVLLVEGNVNIQRNIVVPVGSFLAIAATGDITFGDEVGQAHGMFIADGMINTGNGTEEFKGEGVFATGNFSLGREFAEADDNAKEPIELFKARPDFIMNSYKDADNNLWWFFHKWQEIAP